MTGRAFGRVARVVATVALVSSLTWATADVSSADVSTAGGAPATVDVASADGSVGGSFVGVVPSRVVDTRRSGDGPCVDGTRSFRVAPSAGVPTDAAAVSLNVTVTAPNRNGFLTVFPAEEERPTASNLDYAASQTVPNAVDVKLGAGGRVSVYASGVIVDDGSLRCWGSNMYGQLGNGSTADADVPTGVIGL